MMSIGESSNHQPVKAKNRIIEIDIIRGFALHGVLLVNVVYIGSASLMEIVYTKV